MKKLTFFFILISAFIKAQTLPPVCFNAMNSANTASVGLNPISVINADFNADGNADLAVANYSSNNVSVLMGSGTGSFALAVNYNVGSLPYALTSGDFNNDGKPDLAICNSGSNNVSVLFNLGTGTFGSATNYAVGTNPRAITSGDFNSDGKADLAVANYSTNNVSVLLNTGTGAFNTAVNYVVGANPTSLSNADFNSDGKKDLMVANSNSAFVSLLLGSTTGTFFTSSNLTVPAAANCIINADFNNDGNIDIAMTNSVNVVVLLGTGTGSVSATITTTVVSFGNTFSLISSDYNNDGKMDIALEIQYGAPGNLRILLGTGSGSFSTSNFYWIFYSGENLHLTNADFNNDGSIDIVCAGYYSNSINMVLGVGNGNFLTVKNGMGTIAGVTIGKADFNGDGKLDIASAGGQNLDVALGLGDGTFNFIYYMYWTGPGGDLRSLTIADFNNDTRLDIAVVDNSAFNGYSIRILAGNGSGNFTSIGNYTMSSASGRIINSDFNNDGNVDLAFPSTNSISILFGNGSGGFTIASNVNQTGAVNVSDFNNDGNSDLAVTNFSANSVSILMGTGTGSFLAPVNYVTGIGPSSLLSKDFNNDGNYDLAVLSTNSDNISILMGVGTGSFLVPNNYTMIKPYRITSDDFNGDGKLDLAFINNITSTQNNLSILLGIGNGSFVPSTSYVVGTNASEIISGDYSNDGKVDIVSGNSNTLIFSLLLNGAVLGISATNTVCLGSSINLSAYGASTFTWSTGANTNSITVSPTTNTNYTLTGMSINGCVGSAVKMVSVVSCAAGLIDNGGVESEIVKVFPNPTNGILNVELVNGASTGSATHIQILNTLGQVVYESVITNQQSSINIQQLLAGIYFVKVLEGNKVVGMQKVIKE